MKRALITVALAIAPAALGGCSDPITLDFNLESSPPSGTYFTSDTIEIEEGLAVVVQATPMDEDRDRLDWETTLDLQSNDPRIVDITRLEYPEEDQRKGDDREVGDWYFTFAAAAAGTTQLEYHVDGEFEGEITVHIVPQLDP